MKNISTWSVNLYIFNFALLITHQIDSAFWKEWELFGISGDLDGFLYSNFVLVLIGLIGLKQLFSDRRSGHYIALFFSCGGIFAFFIHMYFIMNGHKEFTSAASIAVLAAALIVSLVQGSFSLLLLLKKRV